MHIHERNEDDTKKQQNYIIIKSSQKGFTYLLNFRT